VRDWRERFPEIDRRFWERKGFVEEESARGVVGFRGTISVRPKTDEGIVRSDFLLRVDYPPGYPYRQPQVCFLEPRIQDARHQAPGPDGAPCLFPPSVWDRDVGPGEFYEATKRWLGYHLQGSFPRELALYELPAYFRPSPYAVLVPSEGIKSFEGRRSGTFALVPLLGHPVCVLHSVDRDQAGEELLAALAEPGLRGRRRSVKWYRLDGEPDPFSASRRLEEILEKSGHQVRFRHQPKLRRHSVGLVFTDEVFGEERLLIVDVAVSKRSSPKTIVKGWSVHAPELHVVSRAVMQRRIEAVRPLERLRRKSVACFGLGAIGSSLALAIGREGVGSVALCDPDTLKPGNVVRHVLDLTSVGQAKALALDTALGRVNPEIETTIEYQNLSDPAVIATALRGADLVVAAIGEEATEELLFEVAAEAEGEGRPAFLLVRTLHGGDAFRVILVRPGLDACLDCLRHYKAEGFEEWIDVPDTGFEEVHEDGCATAAVPGAGLAFQQAASFAAARALDHLEGRSLDANQWLWVERPIKDHDPRLAAGLSLHRATFAPRPGCPICRA
jgi:molybdopterin/thiamine biosynthesis adenylyltransferase